MLDKIKKTNINTIFIKKYIKVIFFLIYIFINAIPLFAADNKTSNKMKRAEAPTIIRGDFVEHKLNKEIIIIKGNAYVQKHDMKLWADTIQANIKDETVLAYGNVVFRQNIGETKGEMLYYEWKTGKGRLWNCFLPITGGFMKAEKAFMYPKKIIAWNCVYTTCNHKPPHYRVTVAKLTLYPKYKMIMDSMKYYEGNTVVFSMKRKESKLYKKQKRKKNAFGYSKAYGIFIKNSTKVLGGLLLYNLYQKGKGPEIGYNKDYTLSKKSKGSLDFIFHDNSESGYNRGNDWKTHIKHNWILDKRYSLDLDLTHMTDIRIKEENPNKDLISNIILRYKGKNHTKLLNTIKE